MKRADAIVIATIMVVILIGMVVACAPNIYRCEFDAWVDEDTVYYEYSSNYSMETHTALIHNDTDYDITEILVYFDENYAAINDWELQEDMFINLAAQLDARSSIDLTYSSISAISCGSSLTVRKPAPHRSFTRAASRGEHTTPSRPEPAAFLA